MEKQIQANVVFTDDAYLKTRYLPREDGGYTIRVGRGGRRDILACKELYGKAVKTARELDCTACAFDLCAAAELGQEGLFAAVEGVCGGAYQKKFALDGRWEPELTCSFPGADAVQLKKAWELAQSIMQTRNLVNCPSNLLWPNMFAQRLKDMAEGLPIEAELYDRQALEQLGIEKINGALLDLGVSSHQLDDAARGFSYRADAPLDMRMSQQGETAADLVNTESREELARILRDYGEEPYAWQIAGKIVETRETAPILTTLQLADIVASAMPPAERRKNKNPSRRTFQALRIAVNHELDALEEGLDTIFDHLAPGGRLCVITFHSLEDRIVKNAFRRNENPCTCPPEFPVCVCGKVSKGKVITRKPILPSAEELEVNSRSKSAKLRVFEKK